jgi:hypothetical protein
MGSFFCPAMSIVLSISNSFEYLFKAQVHLGPEIPIKQWNAPST